MVAPETSLRRDLSANGAAPAPTDGTRSPAEARLRASKGLFLMAAGMSLLFSVYLWFLVDREQGLFVGLWVPSILSLGGFALVGWGGRRE